MRYSMLRIIKHFFIKNVTHTHTHTLTHSLSLSLSHYMKGPNLAVSERERDRRKTLTQTGGKLLY